MPTGDVEVESSWNVMAHGDAREGKWRGNWRMVWVASTLHTTSEHGVSSITTTDAHTSAAISRLNLRPCRFKWTPFRRKRKSGFCACTITFQLASNTLRWVSYITARPVLRLLIFCGDWIIVKYWSNDTDRGSENHSDRKLSRRHFVLHLSHMAIHVMFCWPESASGSFRRFILIFV